MTGLETTLFLGFAVALGAFVQSSIGFGVSVVAAPFVIVFAPELMPGAMLLSAFSLPVVQLSVGPRDVVWRPLIWALAGRVLLTPVGVWLVAVLSPQAIGAFAGVLILIVVALSLTPVRVGLSTRNAVVAGAISGVSGTAASIGGPFLALTLQHERPTLVRATLAAFFVTGSMISVAALALAGEITRAQLMAGLIWLPFIGLGFMLAAPARRHLQGPLLRRLVLAFCAVAAVGVILRA
ncbi:MAG: sulfite exporter TauE/SafE family protein, partial [Micrococcales bacterium]|nr:sulfite exporter TauE/SafE family protein [Micrococcales bacterium]